MATMRSSWMMSGLFVIMLCLYLPTDYLVAMIAKDKVPTGGAAGLSTYNYLV